MRRSAHVLFAFALLATLLFATGVPAGAVVAGESDFNGDGYADAAVGVPYENLTGHKDPGGVNVIYGGAGGMTSVGAQFWNLDSPNVPGTVNGNENCGVAVATGDVNGDGYADLAFGCPYDKVGTVRWAGAVIIVYGSGSGLTGTGSQRITQNTTGVPDDAEVGDGFGWALAFGDLDGDGYDDLAVGSDESYGGKDLVGAVTVLEGSAAGITGIGATQIRGTDVGAGAHAEDYFGFSLATGDTGGDGFDDLAIGSPYRDDGSTVDAGHVAVLDGSVSGLSFLEYTAEGSGAKRYDGFDVAFGDLNGDSYADLAFGEPGANVASTTRSGQAKVLYGSGAGLNAATLESWNRASASVPGSPAAYEWLSEALATGDFDGDGNEDLAMAATTTVSGASGAGSVVVLYGDGAGLSGTGSQEWSQDSTGVLDSAQANDFFGWDMAGANFAGGAEDDLFITAAFEDVSGKPNAGSANLLLGSVGGITATGNEMWNQDSLGIPEHAEGGDNFGWAIGAGMSAASSSAVAARD